MLPCKSPQCPEQRQVVLPPVAWMKIKPYRQFNSLCKNPTKTSSLLESLCHIIRWSLVRQHIQWDSPDTTLDCVESVIKKKWLVLLRHFFAQYNYIDSMHLKCNIQILKKPIPSTSIWLLAEIYPSIESNNKVNLVAWPLPFYHPTGQDFVWPIGMYSLRQKAVGLN